MSKRRLSPVPSPESISKCELGMTSQTTHFSLLGRGRRIGVMAVMRLGFRYGERLSISRGNVVSARVFGVLKHEMDVGMTLSLLLALGQYCIPEAWIPDWLNLTGGILLSRNKEYIVFYRGNDFLKPSIKKLLAEKENLATMKQDEEEVARLRASALIVSNPKISEEPLVAGTLAETLEANTRWANKTSNEEREKMKRKLELSRHASVVRYLERKLGFAQAKIWKAEKALAKVQEFLQPAQHPTDLETVTGIREVFAGTIQNMHLNWKHRELVKIFVKGRNFFEVKQLAVSLEAESGGVLISLDKTTKGYAIIMYRGKIISSRYL